MVYSLAYGGQPALICELVEWALSNGFEIVCAGQGATRGQVSSRLPDVYPRDGLGVL